MVIGRVPAPDIENAMHMWILYLRDDSSKLRLFVVPDNTGEDGSKYFHAELPGSTGREDRTLTYRIRPLFKLKGSEASDDADTRAEMVEYLNRHLCQEYVLVYKSATKTDDRYATVLLPNIDQAVQHVERYLEGLDFEWAIFSPLKYAASDIIASGECASPESRLKALCGDIAERIMNADRFGGKDAVLNYILREAESRLLADNKEGKTNG